MENSCAVHFKISSQNLCKTAPLKINLMMVNARPAGVCSKPC